MPARAAAPPRSEARAARDARWREDLALAARELDLRDRSFTDDARRRFDAALAALSTDVSSLDDDEITVRLGQAIALSGNAHTRLYLLRNRTRLRRFPVRLWWFEDGLFVLRAGPALAPVLGCRVVGIGGHDVAEAAARVATLYAANASWARYMATYTLTSPEILRGLHLSGDAGHVEWTFDCAGHPRTVVLEPDALVRRDTPVEAWWDLSPLSKRDGQLALAARVQTPLPPYLRHADRNYAFEPLPGSNALYFQYNRAQDDADGEPMEAFADRLVRAVTARPATRLVVDLRFNTGGDLGVGAKLMDALAQAMAGRSARGASLPAERARRVSVITGPATFSAGLYHAAKWKAWGARVVGEPAGDALDFWAEGGNVELPRSGLVVHFANGFHRYSQTEYPERRPYYASVGVATLAPDVAAALTSSRYFAGEDPALEAALGD